MSAQLHGTNGIQFNDGTNLSTGYQLGMRNRIINGDMRIDQRNAGASVTPTTDGTYTLDRFSARLTVASKFSVQQNAGSVTPPSGFTNYLGVTSLSAYSVSSTDYFGIEQAVEGVNVADLGWGSANAQSVTLSFRVRSSLTGTFGGVLLNNARDRFYVFTYTISVANTWENKTVTVAGDTSGTWLTNTSSGIILRFGLGAGSTRSEAASTSWATTAGAIHNATGATSVVGTNGATFYITGVQLERGSVATPFEFRQYGTELALCQRYYWRFQPNSSRFGEGFASATTSAQVTVRFPVTMRSAPTALEQSGTAGDYGVAYLATSATCTSVPTFSNASTNAALSLFTVGSVLTAGNGISTFATGANGYLGWSAEL